MLLAERVVVVIESMNGARFVHDELEASGLEVKIADARRAKYAIELLGMTTGAKTDRLDAWRLGELGRLGLVPEIWLADPDTRHARELARFRLHLVRQRTMLKNRIHQSLITHGVARPVSDLFGSAGRAQLERLRLPQSWQTNVEASLALIDHFDEEVDSLERSLHQIGTRVAESGSTYCQGQGVKKACRSRSSTTERTYCGERDPRPPSAAAGVTDAAHDRCLPPSAESTPAQSAGTFGGFWHLAGRNFRFRGRGLDVKL
jgi:putative hemolysin